MKWVKETFFNKKYDKEVLQSKSLAPSVGEIRSVSANSTVLMKKRS